MFTKALNLFRNSSHATTFHSHDFSGITSSGQSIILYNENISMSAGTWAGTDSKIVPDPNEVLGSPFFISEVWPLLSVKKHQLAFPTYRWDFFFAT